MNLNLDLIAGKFSNEPPQSVRTLGQIASIFRDKEQAAAKDPAAVVYEIHGCPAEVEGPAQLLYATTVLYPGQVSGEYFMTRGHFHTNPDRGEFMLTLSGTGLAVLMDRDRNTTTEPMEKGSVHNVDGRLAHRVVNTGSEPLVFLVVWMSDCGHEYDSIQEKGFSKIVVSDGDGFILKD